MQYVIYCRSAGNDGSLPLQLANARDYLEREIGSAPVKDFCEAMVSGIRMDGAKLNEMIEFCAANPGTTVIVESVDRLGRGVETLHRVLGRLESAGANVIAIDGLAVELTVPAWGRDAEQ